MTTTNYASISNQQLWASRVLSGLAALFLLVDGGMKLFKPPVVVEATLKLGYPESAIVGIGIALLAGTLLYLIPRTAILGAVLLTGYLGGAVATNVRVGAPVFNIVFPMIFTSFRSEWEGHEVEIEDVLAVRILTQDGIG
jgi:DoxX-like family